MTTFLSSPKAGKLEQVFIQLRDAGLKINAAKSFFCAQETEYLGYILTRGGIKPQPKKVQAILALNLPKSIKELRCFLGMVQYYRDMWAKQSEMPAPLTDLVGEWGETKATKKTGTKKKPWRWESIHQQAFDNIKATTAKEVVLAYPDFTKPFKIYTNASTTQLGAVITHFRGAFQVQCYQNRTPSHSQNLKGVSRECYGGRQ